MGGDRFPQELLEKTNAERTKYFSNLRIEHSHLERAEKKILRALQAHDPCSLVMVVGPTGVGKTTLLNKVCEVVVESQVFEPGDIPIASIEIPAISSSEFNWGDYYIRALEELGEPLINRKKDPEDLLKRVRDGNWLPDSRRPSIATLRKSVESCLRERKLRAFILDEAQHLRKVASGKKLSDQMDVIKSLANKSKVKHVLIGTYDLLALTDLSGQLNRRMIEIEFSRYRFDKKNERLAFYETMVNMSRHLPVQNTPSFSKDIEYIYVRTLGCIGILKDWLSRSLGLAIENNDSTIEIEHLMETEISDRKLHQIFEELDIGEQYIREPVEINSNKILGAYKKQPKNIAATPKKKRNPRPGTRNPERDVIGTV